MEMIYTCRCEGDDKTEQQKKRLTHFSFKEK
jgi:hypothetical protein